MNLEQARQSFPGLKDKVFLDAACVSLAPVQAQTAVMDFMEMALYCPADDASLHHIQMDEMRLQPVREAAKLLNTDSDHIALVESTTHGLNIAANAIELGKGDNVLVADTEFLQVAIPWSKKQETAGIEVRPVYSHDGGLLTTADFEQAMDTNTKVVCVSSVQWSTGYRLDMESLGELCRARGIWLVVDAIHEVGAMQVNVQQRYADFLIVGGHKWLNAPFGCGFIYLSDRVLNELRPNAYGYLALADPEGGWGEYFRTPEITPFREYHFPPVAKRFEIGGTANYPGAVGLGASLKMINALGIETAESHIRHLTSLLRQELGKTQARLVGDPAPQARSGITVFNYFDTPQQDHALVERILQEKIYISMRYTANVGGIRVSTHFFNNEEDMLKLVDALRGLS